MFFSGKISTVVGTEFYLGVVEGSNILPESVAGRMVDKAFTITHLSASAQVFAFVPPAPKYDIRLYMSMDGGSTYAVLGGGVLATIDKAISNVVSVAVAPILIPQGAVLVASFTQTAGGSGLGNVNATVDFSG